MAEQNLNDAATVSEPAFPPRADQVRRTVWPIVLGIVGLLYAALALAGDIRYLVWAVRGQAASPTAATQPAAFAGKVTTTNLIIGSILSIWLLWASMGLVLRKPGLARSMRTWAFTKLAWLAFMAAVILVGTLQVLRHAHTLQPGEAAGRAIGTILAVLVLILPSAALPIFALIWLNRRRIRNEMATWQQSPLSSEQV
jgi:hypothetical protein